jgi:UDP-glucose 4-epimerase
VNVLITGGAGYIGSHTVVELIAAGHQPVIVDNFDNSSPLVLDRLKQITGGAIPLHEADLCNRQALERVFAQHRFDAVIHFAGLKAVNESVEQPLRYYRNNLDSTLTLCEVMAAHDVKRLVFSSSATVYGPPAALPLTEDMPLRGTNPYGQTKLMIEQILRDLAASDPTWQIALLRYFNPVGAHSSGLIGEDPQGKPNNLMPFLTQVAVGRRDHLSIFGHDYDTPDGTGVRDYLHVTDLAKGHLKALEHMPAPGTAEAYNLGTGTGYSVLEMVAAFEKASGRPIPYKFEPRRPGDIAACYADPAKAARDLHWTAALTLDDMCRDSWHWQSQNPQGYIK